MGFLAILKTNGLNFLASEASDNTFNLYNF